MDLTLVNQWESNKNDFRLYIENNLSKFNECDYTFLVKTLLDKVFFHEYEECLFDSDKVTVIDNGDWQGTLLYVFPKDGYQPDISEYYYTHVSYGSCSGCDTLLDIQGSFYVNDQMDAFEDYANYKKQEEIFVSDIMTLALHLVQNMRKLNQE